VDDLLDFTSREKVLGKPVGNDLREGKVTLPLVYALEQASSAERRAVETILRERNYDRVPFPQILAMVERYQGIARVKLPSGIIRSRLWGRLSTCWPIGNRRAG
jgi:octaprenyl-diphosphate synthase